MAKFHGNEGILEFDSQTIDHFRGFEAEDSVVEIDGNVQGSDFTDPDVGLRSMRVRATVFLDSAAAPIASGQVAAATLTYKDATSDGTITGTFMIQRASTTYQLNQNAAQDLELLSKGAFTITAPS